MLLQQMDDRVQVSRSWFDGYKFHLVKDLTQLEKLTNLCISRGKYSIDCETTGVDNRVYPDEYFEDGLKTRYGIRTVDKVVGLCISFDGLNGYYIPFAHEPEDSGNLPWNEGWEIMAKLINSGAKALFHNAKFDAEFLYPLTGKSEWNRSEFEDIFLMAKVVNPLKGYPAGLKPLTKLHFDVDMVELDELFTIEKKEQLKREKRRYNFALLHPKEGLEYGCSDGIFTYKLEPLLRAKLEDSDLPIYDLEKAFSNVMRKMERNRVHVDVGRVNQLYTECQAALREVGDTIRQVIESKTGSTGKWVTLNIGSPPQLSKCLITDAEGLKLKPTAEMIGTPETGWTTEDAEDDDDDEDEGEKQYSLKDEALKSLHNAYGKRLSVQRPGVVDKDGKPKPESIFELILEYRHYDKMNGSYVEKLLRSHDKYGDVRPSFNQIGTDTTRLSCKAGKIEDGYSGVNFQGIPRDSDEDKPELFKQIRTCIVPRPGWFLVKIDYAGEELRVVTNLSGDPIWTKSFLYEDGDVHSITARTLFKKADVNKDERNRGKRCNFAFIYGGGAGAIQRNVGGDIEDAQRHMSNLRDAVPVLMGYVDSQKRFARKYKCVYTAFGRKIPIPTIDSPIRGVRAKAERCAINYTIQATSADVLKYAMCYVDKKISDVGWDDVVRYVLTVHDEVVYEVRPEMLMEVVRKLDEWMTTPWTIPKAHGRDWVVPLLTEPGIDTNWKARYDYFHMVDGVPADPKLLAEDGSYSGKLKKDQYFLDGRIYQTVPEVLKDHIRRAALELPGPAPEKMLPAPESEPAPIVAELPAVEPESETAVPKKEEETIELGGSLSLDLDSIPISSNPSPSEPSSLPTPAPTAPAPAAPTRPEPPRREVGEDEVVMRWVFLAQMTEKTSRRLRAAFILGEGDVPLRIMSMKGDVMVSEKEGIRVDPEEFRRVAELFGLG